MNNNRYNLNNLILLRCTLFLKAILKWYATLNILKMPIKIVIML